MENVLKKQPVCGEFFDLIPSPDQYKMLREIGDTTTPAFNAAWMQFRLADPTDIGAYAREVRECNATLRAWHEAVKRDGKKLAGPKPKWTAQMAKMDLSAATKAAYEIGKTLCAASGDRKGLHSHIYGCAARQVGQLYWRSRQQFLLADRSIPVSKRRKIAIRQTLISVRVSPENPKWFDLGIVFHAKADPVWFPMKTTGKSEHTLRWLAEVAAGTAKTSDAMLSEKMIGHKTRWRLAVARRRYAGEAMVAEKEPVSGRQLVCYVPQSSDRAEFLALQPEPISGRPWREYVVWRDLENWKYRDERLRRSMGNCYAQSPRGAGRGHGRKRAIKNKLSYRERYERRVNNWIENRSLHIVKVALRNRCEGILMQNLSAYAGPKVLGDRFPYHRFALRVEQKAKESGLTYSAIETPKIEEAA